ncbi:lysophospholipase [Pseudosulfitobacter koreensis]|uniref:Lysophospholipase n=1 Tax=Pseudosulfitobacter koreensis TaxID=2968472 RepID=A0ABT1Z4M2_9RHOB|nr:lysophospholipase [Pseudosulfitobacter koreense]MCR8828065.1 lysophospholipase [Pseudosulfitobacter koreense]
MLLDILFWVVAVAGAAVLVALGLILSEREVAMPGEGDLGVDLSKELARGMVDLPPAHEVEMRDGFALHCQCYGAEGRDVPLVVLIHASSFFGMQMHGLAQSLAGDADVVVPDLRGHGLHPGRRGDVDYIGQMEDDLADLIAAVARPGQKVVLGGHSLGGGLVVRMAGGAHGGLIDHAVLLAPFLNHFAATTRRKTGGWARVMVRRTIGLNMLNAIGIRALNHLSVVQFNIPRQVQDKPGGHLTCKAYSYRLSASYGPRMDFRRDIAALPPFAVIVGTADETFYAEAYAPLMRAVTDKGLYHMVPDVGHMGIVDTPQTAKLIREVIHAL